MSRNLVNSGLILLIVMGIAGCAPTIPESATPIQLASTTTFASSTPPREPTEGSTPEQIDTAVIPVTGHLMKPANVAPTPERLIYDVESAGNAAPYGDSYKINRFERPFLQDMTYVPDLDIISFNLSEDKDWYYLSLELSGHDPNNPLGINYGVEIDLNTDGFGDFIIWAHPPYQLAWDTSTVQVFEDSDKDTAGVSSKQSDAIFEGNGYDKLIFNGGTGKNTDPDLAWVRMNAGERATIQFAFKKSWIGSFFLIGVISDAGLKDVSQLDYSDRFQATDAGSPVRTNPNYPLGSLYAVDNTCWQAYGIQLTAYEPKSCPGDVLPTPTRKPPTNGQSTEGTSTSPPPLACTPDVDPAECDYYDPEVCTCVDPPTEEPTEEPTAYP
ncbi:MAG TPA: hypothetical protein VFH34_12730 [Anaerolineales bacterium]|nr:hypothetical protein [Anaerolineales bacterium]